MALYDYGNTRLRARMSRLFPLAKLETFTELKSIDSLISQLSKSHYKTSIEISLTHSHGYGCITEALNRELMDVHNLLERFYAPEIWEKLSLIFLRVDVQNIKAIIRGVTHKVPITDIINSLSPLGTISTDILSRIAKSKDIQDAIDRITVYKLEFAQKLMAIKGKDLSYGASEIERLIEIWYYEKAQRLLTGTDVNSTLIREMNAFEADIINLNIALRYVNASNSPEILDHPIDYYLIEGGTIAKNILLSMSNGRTVENAINMMKNTRYYPNLKEALASFEKNGLLSEFESKLRLLSLAWMSKLPKTNPFGIGVPMGYVALKKSEIRNIRWIAKGIYSGFDPVFIRENIERLQ